MPTLETELLRPDGPPPVAEPRVPRVVLPDQACDCRIATSTARSTASHSPRIGRSRRTRHPKRRCAACMIALA